MTNEADPTGAERSRIIRAIQEARAAVDAAQWECERPGGPESGDLDQAYERLESVRERLDGLLDSYERGSKERPISRDPFTGEVFRHAMDTEGLDGPWWDSQRPARPMLALGPNLFAFTGAVTITGRPPRTPFPVKPGPAVPWVSPRLLSLPGVRAVLSYLRIGPYPAYAVVYFASPHPWGHPALNTWGTGRYIARHRDGSGSVESTWDLPEEYDFDIAPWIRRGRVLWIAPEDPGLQLHGVLEGCPYIGLEGYRHPVRLEDGVMENCLLDAPRSGSTGKGG